MKNILTLIVLFILICTEKLSAQTVDSICGTESLDSVTFVNLPWIENNQFLLDLVDSIEGSCNNCRVANNGLSTKKYQVPIKAHVYYNSMYPRITDAEVQQYIREVNRIFDENGVGIQFYLVCNISPYLSHLVYIDDADDLDVVLGNNFKDNAINVHFIYRSPKSGSAKIPYKLGLKYSCVINTYGGYNKEYATTLAHELGHTLGLSHTHDKGKFLDKSNAELNNCNQESVNKNRNQEWYCWFKFSAGKKCDRNADGLCDTDADPNWNFKIGEDCSTYNTAGLTTDYIEDNYGDAWGSLGNNNAMRNIMSYSRKSCRNEFTTMQKGVMYYSLLKSGLAGAQSNPAKFRSNPDLDVYEPDNYWFGVNPANPGVFANKIGLNTQQYHTFHHSNSSSDSWEACDIDWVYFENDLGGTKSFIIQTFKVDDMPEPNTKITLYNVNTNGTLGSQIATHDDNSSSDKFSKITRNLAIGYYAVKIENKVTNIALDSSKGHYYIRVDACYDRTLPKVTGANAICGASQTYYVSNIPAGATVTWFQTYNDLTLTPSGNSCVVTALTRGDVMLYAVVSYCGFLDTFSKKITINMPQYTYFASGSYRTAYPNIDDDFGLNMQCYGSTPSISSIEYVAHYENYSSITWTKLSSYPTATSALWSSNVGGDPRKIKVHLRAANASLTLKATVTNGCGTISNTYTFLSNGVSCSTAMMRGVSEPLEVDYYDAYMSYQTLMITYKDEEENKSELAKIILSDKMGNILLEKTDATIKENQIQIDMSSYKSDNYYVILQYADGNIEPQQVAKF